MTQGPSILDPDPLEGLMGALRTEPPTAQGWVRTCPIRDCGEPIFPNSVLTLGEDSFEVCFRHWIVIAVGMGAVCDGWLAVDAARRREETEDVAG